jgi:hypothetical protein
MEIQFYLPPPQWVSQQMQRTKWPLLSHTFSIIYDDLDKNAHPKCALTFGIDDACIM